jgi:HEPN domain-containing protein
MAACRSRISQQVVRHFRSYRACHAMIHARFWLIYWLGGGALSLAAIWLARLSFVLAPWPTYTWVTNASLLVGLLSYGGAGWWSRLLPARRLWQVLACLAVATAAISSAYFYFWITCTHQVTRGGERIVIGDEYNEAIKRYAELHQKEYGYPPTLSQTLEDFPGGAAEVFEIKSLARARYQVLGTWLLATLSGFSTLGALAVAVWQKRGPVIDAESLAGRVHKFKNNSLLKQVHAELPEYLEKAVKYINDNAPKESLTNSRQSLEALLEKIFIEIMGRPPRSAMLADMLNDNQFTRKIEPDQDERQRILELMQAIRGIGKLGPHPYRATQSDALGVLEKLCEVLDWYVDKRLPNQAKMPTR